MKFRAAHDAAIGPADFVLCTVVLMTVYPIQSEQAYIWYFRSPLSR